MGQNMGQMDFAEISLNSLPTFYKLNQPNIKKNLLKSEDFNRNLARSIKKDITGFSGKSTCDKAFSDFLIFFWPSSFVVGGIFCLFNCEPKKISSQLVKGDSVA